MRQETAEIGDQLYEYIRAGRNGIQGWFGRVDGEIFSEILSLQNSSGAGGGVVEIGVHHGKSFISLCLGLSDGQRAYAIDLFEHQELNLDFSGRGNREAFLRNLDTFRIARERVTIDARASEKVKPEDIYDSVGAVRFFSIDGGHWREVVRSDLHLATSVLSEEGVIALDDFMRAEWPDVSFGFSDWFEQSDKSIVPVAIGFNKLYLCRRPLVPVVQKRIAQSKFLRHFLSKHYEVCGITVPVYQTFRLPDVGIRTRARDYLKLYHPDVFVWLISRWT